MSKAVLMPGNRTAKTRLLDPNCFVERREIAAVNRGSQGQQTRMTVQA